MAAAKTPEPEVDVEEEEDEDDVNPKLEKLMSIGGVIAAVLMFIGIRMYTAAKKSCPSGLRKKLFISMVITAFGCGMKIVLFFMPMIWALTEPTEIIVSDGSKMTVLGQDVYDRNGNLVGSVTDRGPKSMTVRRR